MRAKVHFDGHPNPEKRKLGEKQVSIERIMRPSDLDTFSF